MAVDQGVNAEFIDAVVNVILESGGEYYHGTCENSILTLTYYYSSSNDL